MIAVLTGDIINSRKVDPSQWFPILKGSLSKYGKEPKQWEIYRGDSFQLETTPEKALEAALLLKAGIRQYKPLDVRIAIGLGEKDYDASKITQANGSAHENSGKCFENLKKQRLLVSSGNHDFDRQINLMLNLAGLTINEWLPTTAAIVKTAILNPDFNQNQLAHVFGKDQSNISRALKRAGYDELQQLMAFYASKVNEL